MSNYIILFSHFCLNRLILFFHSHGHLDLRAQRISVLFQVKG